MSLLNDRKIKAVLLEMAGRWHGSHSTIPPHPRPAYFQILSGEEERLKRQRYSSTFQEKAANRPYMKLIKTNHLQSNNAKLASLMAGNGSVLLSDGHTIQVYANQSNEGPSKICALFTSEFKHATVAFCELSESDITAIERLLSCECPITRMLEYEKWCDTRRPAFVWQ